MDTKLTLHTAPALDPVWIQHEKGAGLLNPQPVFASIIDRQPAYSKACVDRNTHMLSGRDKHLMTGIKTVDSEINASDGRPIKIRTYTPDSLALEDSEGVLVIERLVVYYHGGGLRVGDLDSEDLSCRRICKDASITVISVDYRLMPQNPPEMALSDAYDAFLGVTSISQVFMEIYLVGSSSGGQLAAQVTQLACKSKLVKRRVIRGLLLRCPVTINAAEGGKHIPNRFRDMHTSFSSSFETSLLKIDEVAARENTLHLPLEAETFEGLPPTFIQVCTNDIYYSDGICYAKALQEGGVEVMVDVVHGWPHTFWLKAPHLDRALEAEVDMIKGLKWLLEVGKGSA